MCVTPFLSTVYSHVVYSPLVFLEAESSIQFGIGGHRFFASVGAIMNLKSFDISVERKLSMFRLFFFLFLYCLFYCLFICCKTKMNRLIWKVIIIDLSIFGQKGQKLGTNLYNNSYIAAKKLELRRPFAFSLFQHLDLVANR